MKTEEYIYILCEIALFFVKELLKNIIPILVFLKLGL